MKTICVQCSKTITKEAFPIANGKRHELYCQKCFQKKMGENILLHWGLYFIAIIPFVVIFSYFPQVSDWWLVPIGIIVWYIIPKKI